MLSGDSVLNSRGNISMPLSPCPYDSVTHRWSEEGGGMSVMGCHPEERW